MMWVSSRPTRGRSLSQCQESRRPKLNSGAGRGEHPGVRGVSRKQGTYFLKRGDQERGIYYSHDPIISFNRMHIMGKKPEHGYNRHRPDSGGIYDTGKLEFEAFALIATRLRNYAIPPIVNRGDATNIFAGFTCPATLRAVLAELTSEGLLEERMGPQGLETERLACLEGWKEEPRLTGLGKTKEGKTEGGDSGSG